VPINKIDISESCLGSARVSRAGGRVFAIADYVCSGRRAACKIKKPQPTRLPLQVYFGVGEAANFGSADRSGANRTLDRAGAAQE
jgi:hypothetical protein